MPLNCAAPAARCILATTVAITIKLFGAVIAEKHDCVADIVLLLHQYRLAGAGERDHIARLDGAARACAFARKTSDHADNPKNRNSAPMTPSAIANNASRIKTP